MTGERLTLLPAEQQVSALNDLQKVRSPHGGLFASANVLFGDAEFGRDQAEAAEDIRYIKPDITEQVLLNLARRQGRSLQKKQENETPLAYLTRVQNYVRSGEEDGKIHHEYRSRTIHGPETELSPKADLILQTLSHRWGGTPDEVRYYGSVDATGLFARLKASYLLDHPERRDFLKEQVVDVTGQTVTMEESLIRANGWLMQKMDDSELGLIEFHNTNPFGIANQVWMDSGTSIMHTTGEDANHLAPIAPIEVQGVAYDAYRATAELFQDDPSKQDYVAKLSAAAATLQKNILEQFWMPEEEYFAQAIDRDEMGNPRQVKLRSSNAALLLDTKVFDDLKDKDKQRYVGSLVKAIMSSDFLTDAGVRCAAIGGPETTFIDHNGHAIENSVGYHGSQVSWPKQTYDIAKGLRRQGFDRLAEQLENRILNAVNIANANYEFFYVNRKGEVNYNPYDQRPANMPVSEMEILTGTNLPERTQTWTDTAVLGIKYQRGQREKSLPDTTTWQYQLESEILEQLKHVDAYTTKDEIAQATPEQPPFLVTIYSRDLSRLSRDEEQLSA